MHIHGRACNWRSMILTQTDYDRLYRRDDLNRVPFEYARRIMMGGNPIVFVGLGMTEEELNQELREFVSNAQYQRVAPLFLLWSDDSLNASQISYALHTEVHRVRCEASMLTARIRLAMADFEGALRFATDAMMVASRYGMELRKISLRALIAEIMAARGHPVTAERLARTCIKMATRRRFQTAIDKASRVLAQLPKMSSAIVHSDHSGMRTLNFPEAREHWRTLARQGELTPQIESALARCELWIARDQTRKAA